MPPDEPNEEERLEQLPEDGQTPFSPADPLRGPDAGGDDDRQAAEKLDDTHPDTDTDIQQEDVYEQGVPGAAGVSEPNAGNTVVDYHSRPQDEEA
ncbi:MAG TPA: hypothetical protein VF261_01235 [Candidatus Saccharimonadales bacterium]